MPERAAGTEQDRAEILAHIRTIFEAYIRRDRETIRRTHTPDWTGFQNPSTRIERGLDDYMRNAETSLRTLRGTGFEILDSDVQVHGDRAVVFYVARYDYAREDRSAGSVPLRSVDLYRREPGGWIQHGSHIGVIPAVASWTADH